MIDIDDDLGSDDVEIKNALIGKASQNFTETKKEENSSIELL